MRNNEFELESKTIALMLSGARPVSSEGSEHDYRDVLGDARSVFHER